MDPRFGLGGPPVYFGKVGGPPVWWTPGLKKLSSTLFIRLIKGTLLTNPY